jgi:hypothetical protein
LVEPPDADDPEDVQAARATPPAAAAAAEPRKDRREIEPVTEPSDVSLTDRSPHSRLAQCFKCRLGGPLYSTLQRIVDAIGVSRTAASKIRSGKLVPHVRHWAVLAKLASAST